MFNNNKIKAISFGEVLFDVFGDHKKIGGAPLNLALRTASYGFPVTIISAVGNDENGEEILDYIRKKDLEISAINVSQEYQTGIVQVSLNESGSATYEIKFPSAWDFISADQKIVDTVKDAEVFFYGSLACRNEVSQNTLFSLLDSNTAMFKVFDVNLRKPFYNIQLLEELMNKADFIKFNDEEILEIAGEMGFQSDDLMSNIKFLAEKTDTKAICVTLGKHGSVLLWNDHFYRHKGYRVTVKDTVGAGDSFLANLISKLLTDHNPEEALNFASAVGALVAGYSGANPQIENSEIEMLIRQNAD
ncbi:carbohydrate kinase family protein [Chryseobacterium caseinilyticum]|uniref:Carbohydrate kinase n=1 Tax=Chryseobacterium caseinilyticum TaxID=2771428 RepID=A0ABR8Z850_9FLAO|nr:carbohydrate kinase [Chryseobacterium caseinilyticum]MBD8081058.1 carbohydrate kinase [Chryseobacterium caseinilyticum]